MTAMQFKEVSGDEFFARLKADARDIMPRAEPYESIWECVRTRSVFGKTEPGYKSPHGTPQKYLILVNK